MMKKTRTILLACLVMGFGVFGFSMMNDTKTQPASLAIEGDNLRVELIWQTPVDLDLFVTGPSGETVYYGNRQSKNYDKIVEESNCESSAAEPNRLRETVLIPSAQEGEYRVSVDFIFHCGTKFEKVDAELILFNVQTDVRLSKQVITVKRQFLNTVAMVFEVRKK